MNVALNFWRDRLRLPAYKVGDAARYAHISSSTAFRWQSIRTNRPILSVRQERASLSYLQLIELAVVASIKRAGIKLDEIQRAREYVARELKSDYPFAEYKFKTDGASLMLDMSDFNPTDKREHLVHTGKKHGQLAWQAIVPVLHQFEYDDDIVSRWTVYNKNQSIIIDPRISYGAPSISGTPTWVIHDKFKGGNDVSQVAYDYDLTEQEVLAALDFEGCIAQAENRSLN